MAAHEHHPQTVVREFLVGENRHVGRGALSLHQPDEFGFLVAENLFAPDHIQRQVAGSPHDPRGRIFRNAVKRPRLQRSGQRFLNHVFGQAEVLDAENPRQGGHHLSRLMTEKMFHHLGHFLRWWLVAVKLRLAHGISLFTGLTGANGENREGTGTESSSGFPNSANEKEPIVYAARVLHKSCSPLSLFPPVKISGALELFRGEKAINTIRCLGTAASILILSFVRS